jgi:hypothetical protein
LYVRRPAAQALLACAEVLRPAKDAGLRMTDMCVEVHVEEDGMIDSNVFTDSAGFNERGGFRGN